MSKYPNDFWHVWNENAINTIDWLKPVATDVKGKAPKAPVPEPPVEIPKYFDPEVSILPKQYLCEVYTWKRPGDIPVVAAEPSRASLKSATSISSTMNVSVLSDENYDLISQNQHLKSSYYDHIMDSVHILRNYSFWQPEDFDGFGFEKWSPLNHIYSGDPVKFGEPHTVSINNGGKYAVRLFHCGAWRTIIVDDRVPVTKANKILIPVIRKTSQLDIWPLLLIKAILKLNFCRTIDDEFYLDQSHTSECKMYDEERCFCKTFIPNNVEYLHDERDIQRLNVIYLLTGWHLLEIDYSNRYLSDVWKDIKRYLDHYHIALSKENSRRASRRSGRSIDTFEIKFMPLVVFDLLLPECESSKQKRKYAEILCSKYRDTPLYKEIEQEEIPNWKTFRWIYWAMENNIWQPLDVTSFWSILCKYNTSEKCYYSSLLESEWDTIVNPPEAGGDATVKRMSSRKSKDELRRRSSIKNKTTEDWFSFRKILSHIQGIKVLTRRISFDSEYLLSDEVEPPPPPPPPLDPKALKAKASKEKAAPPPEPEPTKKKVKLTVDNNSEYYIFVDLKKGNKILVDLNVVKLCPEQASSSVDFEFFRWNCPKHTSVCHLDTKFFMSCKIDYSRGRSVYKININSNKFCLRVSAEDQIQIFTFYELLDALNTNSLRMTDYFEEVKNAFLLAVQFIGKEEFIEHMQSTYSSILNFCNENCKKEKVFRRFLYDKFIKNLFKYLEEMNETERILPLRKFFFLHILKPSKKVVLRDPDWKELIKKYNEIKDDLCDCPDQKNPYFSNEDMERIYKNAAITIQAAFKSYYIRLFMSPHFSMTNITFKESIISWYNKYFIESPRMMYEILYRFFFTCLQDLEDIVLAEEYGRNSLILNFYDFFEDFRSSLRVLTFPAQTNLAYQWTFLKICYLLPHAVANMKFILYAFTNLFKGVLFSIKVFRADDLTEVPCSDAPYLWSLSHKTSGGYKIFIYMYSSQPLQDFNWMFKVGFPRHIGFPVIPNTEKMPDNFFVEDVLKAKVCNWEDWVTCSLDGLIYQNDTVVSLCDCEIYVVEKSAIIFVLFEYFGEGLELTLKIVKYNNTRPFMTRKMSHHDHFYKIIPQGTYKLQILYEQVGEPELAEVEEEELGSENGMRLIGNWYVKVGHEQCVDVEVTDLREEKISI